MTIEEKAKAYDEALERAKGIYAIDKVTMEYLFPELAESEDEKIRKEIIDFIQWAEGRNYMRHDYHQAKRPSVWLDWLEKQKEPLPIPDKFSGLKSLMLQYLQSAANRKDDTEIESDTDLWGRKILDYVWKYGEKQKEQKPIQTKIERLYVRTLKSLISDFLRGKDEVDFEYYQQIYDWLDRRHIEQKSVEWNEEDELMRSACIAFIQDEKFKGYERAYECVDWLKSLCGKFVKED